MNANAALTKFVDNHLIDQNCVYSVLYKENPEKKSRIIGDLSDFLVGSADTTPAALTQALLRLKWHPEKTRKLEEEINKVIPDSFDLNKLTME